MLNKYAIVEDPESSWRLDDSYIEDDPRVRGLSNYRVVECFRYRENAQNALETKYGHKRDHMKIVNVEEERKKKHY